MQALLEAVRHQYKARIITIRIQAKLNEIRLAEELLCLTCSTSWRKPIQSWRSSELRWEITTRKTLSIIECLRLYFPSLRNCYACLVMMPQKSSCKLTQTGLLSSHLQPKSRCMNHQAALTVNLTCRHPQITFPSRKVILLITHQTWAIQALCHKCDNHLLKVLTMRWIKTLR